LGLGDPALGSTETNKPELPLVCSNVDSTLIANQRNFKANYFQNMVFDGAYDPISDCKTSREQHTQTFF